MHLSIFLLASLAATAQGSPATTLPDTSKMNILLIDIEDYPKAISEAARVLRPGGRLMVVNLTGIATSSEKFWLRDKNKRKVARLVEFYGEPRRVIYHWSLPAGRPATGLVR